MVPGLNPSLMGAVNQFTVSISPATGTWSGEFPDYSVQFSATPKEAVGTVTYQWSIEGAAQFRPMGASTGRIVTVGSTSGGAARVSVTATDALGNSTYASADIEGLLGSGT